MQSPNDTTHPTTIIINTTSTHSIPATFTTIRLITMIIVHAHPQKTSANDQTQCQHCP